MKKIMQNNGETTVLSCYLLCFVYLILYSLPIIAQMSIPREYDLEEYILLDKDIKMSDALEIINQFSMRYENKLLIDSK